MTTQHTPGLWEVGHDGSGAPIITFEARDIATVEAYYKDAEANARLIAAAPELLEELCNAREWLDELCGLIQSGMFDAASDWVGANAVSTDSALAATIEKAMGEPVMAA